MDALTFQPDAENSGGMDVATQGTDSGPFDSGNGSTGGFGFCGFGICRLDSECPQGISCGHFPNLNYGSCGFVDLRCNSHSDCLDPNMPYCREHPSGIGKFCGSGCFDHQDCASFGALGKCNSTGNCTSGCTNDAECVSAYGQNYWCRPPSSFCSITPEFGSCIISSCQTDSECSHLGSGSRCRDCGTSRYCVRECSSDSECVSRLNNGSAKCDAHTRICYVAGQDDGMCVNDTDCPSDQYCKIYCFDVPCGIANRCHDRCQSDADCSSGVCSRRTAQRSLV